MQSLITGVRVEAVCSSPDAFRDCEGLGGGAGFLGVNAFSVDISEYVILSNGQRVLIADDLGFFGRAVETEMEVEGSLSVHTRADGMRRIAKDEFDELVMLAIGLDDENCNDSYGLGVIQFVLSQHGVDATREQLCKLPVRIVYDERISRLLES